MPDPQTAARFYLTPPAGHFWQWSEDGEVVVWQRGATIAFRKELKAVVERLAPRGLPPFDEILLLFASCRWDSAPSTDLIIAMFESDTGADGETSSWPYEAFSSIDQMWRLPADVREPLEAKALLAEVVFETRPPVVSPEVARVIVELLETASPTGFRQRVEFLGITRSGTLRQSVDYLIRGMGRVDVESLRLRRRTGLDVSPQPAKTDEEPASSPGELIARLSEDLELGGMARLARNLLAVTDLPRSVSDSDELPLGGVSDIGNRGSFDRLLLSELAQDDLTLSVRVALNEALYLRRESPPRNPPQRRLILIDSGLRMWGVPRVYAAAVALAFAARTAKGAESAAWRAAGEALELVDLRTREGLVKHLEALEATLHPGAALSGFVCEMEQGSEPPEAVLITEADSLNDDDFERALAEHAPARLFLATVRRNGEFRLWLRTPHGRKLIREATLDLERILFEPAPRHTPRVPLIDKSQQPLPAIFQVRPFPLRIPHRLYPKRVFFFNDSRDRSVMMSRAVDGRLTLWDEPSQGPRQIAEGVPGGPVLWSCVSRDERIAEYLVQSTPQARPQLVRVRLSDGNIHVKPLNWVDDAVLGASHQGDLLILTGRERSGFVGARRGGVSAAYHRSTGEMAGALAHSEDSIQPGSRFVLSKYRVQSSEKPKLTHVCWTGDELEAVPVSTSFPEKSQIDPMSLIMSVITGGAVFQIRGTDGPFAIQRSGSLLDLSSGEGRPLSLDLGPPMKVWDVEAEGATVIVEAEVSSAGRGKGFKPGRFAVHVRSGEAVPIAAAYTTINQWRVANHPPMPTQRRRWKGIAAVGSQLFLQSRRWTWWSIDSQLKLNAATDSPTGIRQFVEMPRGTPYRMSSATWCDGSRAFVDRRGLIHLQSSGRDIPETTFVLTDQGISGWCADGRVFGDPYFIGYAAATDRETIYREVLEPFALHCRPDA